MPTNLFANTPAAVVAKQTINFAAAGVTASNMLEIFEVGNPNKSYKPGRTINPISGFTAGKGYYLTPLQNLDFSAFLIPPIPEAGEPGATTPEAPSVSADDTANTLSFSHALGTGEIEVSVNDGAYGNYAGPYSVGDVARPQGYWKARTKAATNRNPSAVTPSPAFTVAGGAVTSTIHKAYSLRRVNPNYAGPAVQVKTYPNLAVQDIGFDGSGNLDTAALAAFAAGQGSVIVKTWYDQSGNGQHFISDSDNEAPEISTTTAKPSMKFNGTAFTLRLAGATLRAQPFKLYAALSNIVAGGNQNLLSAPDSSFALGFSGSGNMGLSAGVDLAETGANRTQGIVIGEINGINSRVYVNGVQRASGNAGTNGIQGNVYIGSYAGTSNFLNANLYELVIYADNNSTAAAINTTVNNYYNLH